MAKKFFMGAALGVVALACSVTAQAAYTVTMNQVGTDVVATGSGSLNLGAAGGWTSGGLLAYVEPDFAVIVVGATASVDAYPVAGAGPASFGPGLATLASSGSGPIAGISGGGGFGGALAVPSGYVSGAPLGTSSATYAGQTLADLGITPGTYVWTWGSGPTADSFTLNVGSATSIPTLSEWGTIFLATLLGMLGSATLRRRSD